MIRFVLNATLEELDLTRNKLAVEAKVRPNTINDMAKNKIQRMDLSTLNDVIDTLNRLAIENKIDRRFDINDIIQYICSNSEQSKSK